MSVSYLETFVNFLIHGFLFLLYIDNLIIWYKSNSKKQLQSLLASGGSIYNLYADDDEDTEASPSGQQIIENSVTMTKMKLLKAKMENMNLSKKVKPLTFLPHTEQFEPSHSNPKIRQIPDCKSSLLFQFSSCLLLKLL